MGLQGYTLSEQTKKLLKTIQPAGIIFFEHNIKNKNQIKNLIKEINKIIEVKLFIAVDQEGGSVERLRNVCTSTPSPWGLSKLGLKELLAAQKIIVDELLELGFNMNFVPVLDINSNPANPIIGTRSLGNHPAIVAKYSSKIIEMYLKQKMIPVGKHFPGHGDLSVDSHLSLPVLNKSKSELANFELIPFKEAIKSKIPALMAGHIQVPAYEKEKIRPSSLSKNILMNLLRKELGFKGLIITDELNMKGITKNYDLNTAAHEAIISGADMILFNWNEKDTLKTYEYLTNKVKKDPFLQKRINESYERVLALKKKYLIKKIKRKINTKLNRKISHDLAERTVHWIKRDLFYIPVKKTDPIEIIYPISPKLREEDLLKICSCLGIRNKTLVPYKINPDPEEIGYILKKSNSKKRKILITYDAKCRTGQRALINQLLNKSSDLCMISAGLENDIEVAPKIRYFISAYAPNYISLLSAVRKLMQ
ncbi:MAG: hypothetical protein A3B68_08370 [Candidatus Melainabacteria bacterium RIFCSPHIGHO2_02_FULL_34_12]|nr:MAG: hypothetical protein A3B68_08370 [Candidatus Melainabacteria bacterium RIFCSPHIGHO2_02_FULL_34_12]